MHWLIKLQRKVGLHLHKIPLSRVKKFVLNLHLLFLLVCYVTAIVSNVTLAVFVTIIRENSLDSMPRTSTRTTFNFKFSCLFSKNKHPRKPHCTQFLSSQKLAPLLPLKKLKPSPDPQIIKFLTFDNLFYYINTNEIPGELSRENLISSHVKISPSLWQHNKSRLSHQKTIKEKWFGISLLFI